MQGCQYFPDPLEILTLAKCYFTAEADIDQYPKTEWAPYSDYPNLPYKNISQP